MSLLEKSMVNKLSGGEKQKLSVILALIPNPQIVFLDELTTGLDVGAWVLPLTQGIKLMKAVSMGQSVNSFIGLVILLVAVTIICTTISVKTFRWE